MKTHKINTGMNIFETIERTMHVANEVIDPLHLSALSENDVDTFFVAEELDDCVSGRMVALSRMLSENAPVSDIDVEVGEGNSINMHAISADKKQVTHIVITPFDVANCVVTVTKKASGGALPDYRDLKPVSFVLPIPVIGVFFGSDKLLNMVSDHTGKYMAQWQSALASTPLEYRMGVMNEALNDLNPAQKRAVKNILKSMGMDV